MSKRRQVLRRVAFSLFAVYLVVTLTFGFVALTPDPNVPQIRFAVAQSTHNFSNLDARVNAAVSAYRDRTNQDEPVLQRYENWLVNVATLDWGTSYRSGQPVTAVIAERLPYTLAYVVPAMVLAGLVGVAFGLYSATHRYGLPDWLGSAAAYVGLGVPNFWLASVLILLVSFDFAWVPTSFAPEKGVFASENLLRFVLPAAILTTGLVAGQLRYVRAETSEYVRAEFVTLLRAKGATGWRVARHVLRNAAVPLLSLFFVETLAVLVFDVFVIEYVFKIPGFGLLTYQAIKSRDLPLIIGTTMVIAFVGIAGNLVQDVAYVLLDPRVEDDD